MQDGPILDVMVEEKVIDFNGLERISALSTRRERVVAILMSLFQHPKGYSTLIKALESDASGEDWLAQRLHDCMIKSQQEID